MSDIDRGNTNLAAEFFALSTLHRLGFHACLTLGNKKAVDIFVYFSGGRAITLDVKGVAGPHDWTVQPAHFDGDGPDFFVLVSYEGLMADTSRAPSVWVVPTRDAERFVKHYKGRSSIARSRVVSEGERFRHAWSLLGPDPEPQPASMPS